MEVADKDVFVLRDMQDERFWLAMNRAALTNYVATFETLEWCDSREDDVVYSNPDNYVSGTFIRDYAYWISFNTPQPDMVFMYYREKLDFNEAPIAFDENDEAIYANTNSDNIVGAAVLCKHHLKEFIKTAKYVLTLSNDYHCNCKSNIK